MRLPHRTYSSDCASVLDDCLLTFADPFGMTSTARKRRNRQSSDNNGDFGTPACPPIDRVEYKVLTNATNMLFKETLCFRITFVHQGKACSDK